MLSFEKEFRSEPFYIRSPERRLIFKKFLRLFARYILSIGFNFVTMTQFSIASYKPDLVPMKELNFRARCFTVKERFSIRVDQLLPVDC